jgi:hypothetical protein
MYNVILRGVREPLLPRKSNRYYLLVSVCMRARACMRTHECTWARRSVHAQKFI